MVYFFNLISLLPLQELALSDSFPLNLVLTSSKHLDEQLPSGMISWMLEIKLKKQQMKFPIFETGPFMEYLFPPFISVNI
jgi:hypothetical protein